MSADSLPVPHQVGYCQGVSFVAGILLLHMSEEQAFDMLKFLMYDLGFRRQYRPDMVSLQVRPLIAPHRFGVSFQFRVGGGGGGG